MKRNFSAHARTSAGGTSLRWAPLWGGLCGGIVLPFGLFLLAAALGDTGGPLIWPLLSGFFGMVGVLVGFVAKGSDPREQSQRTFGGRLRDPRRIAYGARLVAGLAIVFGAALVAGGWCLPMLSNPEEYNRQYGQLGLHESDNVRFRELRREFLTPRIACEDYGGSLIAGGLMLLLAMRWRHYVATLLHSRRSCLWFGAGVVSVSVLGSEYGLLLARKRGEFPWWGTAFSEAFGALF